MVRSIVFWLLLVFVPVMGWASAGLYVDNGRGQTVRYEDVTLDDQQQLEMEILTLLGLPERPKKSRHGHPPSLKKSAPRFLLDIYRWLQPDAGVGHVRLPRNVAHEPLKLSSADQKAIARSDVVMTFANKNQYAEKLRHSKGYRLRFNLSRVKKQNLSLLMAVLRVYQSLGEKRWTERRNFTVRVYSIGPKNQLELVATKNVTNHDQGWLEFRLSRLFHAWVHQNKPNLGLYIFAETDGHVVKLTDIGLAATHHDDQAHQPFLVGFFKGEQLIKSAALLNSQNRLKRSMARPKKRVTDRKNPLLLKAFAPRSCRIRTLFISFKSLGWQDWILAPDGYFASFCGGDCNFPLNAHMNATNHAIVQTLVHLTTPKKAPKPSCAPVKLYPISILYYQADNSVTMKKFKNMAVKSCGCQ